MASAPDAIGRGPVFGTLGPAGGNHDFVAAAFLAAHGLVGRVRLFPDFDDVFAALGAGDVDFVLQVAVHPSVAQSVGGNLGAAHLIDAFVAPSQPMAVLVDAACAQPESLALMPATRSYVDVARWRRIVETPSTVDAWAMLAAGQVDSALTLKRFADAASGRYRIDAEIGAVTDAWLIYGRAPLPAPGWSLWRDAPAARMYRAA